MIGGAMCGPTLRRAARPTRWRGSRPRSRVSAWPTPSAKSPLPSLPHGAAPACADFFGGASIDAADLILSPTFAKKLKQVASLGLGAAVRRRDPKPQR